MKHTLDRLRRDTETVESQWRQVEALVESVFYSHDIDKRECEQDDIWMQTAGEIFGWDWCAPCGRRIPPWRMHETTKTKDGDTLCAECAPAEMSHDG